MKVKLTHAALISLIAFLTLGPTALANFPPQVTLVLREKMSCRGVKKMVKTQRLFVHCNQGERLAKAYSADYFGRQPLDEVLKTVGQFSKVEVATPYVEHFLPERSSH